MTEQGHAKRREMPASFSGDSQHVLKCLAGDWDAFGPLVQRYQNAAYAIALNYVRNRADAQDIVQDAFVTAYCKLVQLRDPALFGAWLRRIVVTSCKEWLRRQRSSQSYVYALDAAEGDLADAAGVEDLNQTRRADLWDAVDRLPEHYRSVVLMHYLSGLSYEEIAAFLDVPVSTIRGRLQQSRIRLRAALLPVEKEEVEMNQIDVTKAVRDAVCQIATERFREVIPLGDAPHVVLYCGVDTDVEVREAEGDDVILEGTKASIGFSQEAAHPEVYMIRPPVRPDGNRWFFSGQTRDVPKPKWVTGWNSSYDELGGVGHFWTPAIQKPWISVPDRRTRPALYALADGPKDLKAIEDETGLEDARAVIAEMVAVGYVVQEGDRLRLAVPAFTEAEDRTLCPVVDRICREVVEGSRRPGLEGLDDLLDSLGFEELRSQYPVIRAFVSSDISGYCLEALIEMGHLGTPPAEAPGTWACWAWKGEVGLISWDTQIRLRTFHKERLLWLPGPG